MKSVVLLSSGLDSTVNLYEARARGEVVLALTFDYGQRAAAKEIDCSQKLCQELGVRHRILNLDFFKDFGKSSLIDSKISLPLTADVSIDDYSRSLQTAKAVWVPNRNGIFLNIAAGFAEALDAQVVIPGFNREEATTFPDNSYEFLEQTSQAFRLSTANSVRVECFTVHLNKTEIVRRGEVLGVNWSLIWPCYQALAQWCGQCESCLRSRRAFEACGLKFGDMK